MKETVLEQLREFDLIKIRKCPQIKSRHPFIQNHQVTLEESFYFVKKSYLKVLKEKKLLLKPSSVFLDEDILGWALEIGKHLGNQEKEVKDSESQASPYKKHKGQLLLSKKRITKDSTEFPSYVSYALLEIFYLIKAVQWDWPISKTRSEGFTPSKKNPFCSRPSSDCPWFHEVYVEGYNPPLGWIPAGWCHKDLGKKFQFRGENRRAGRLLLADLEALGLIEKDSETDWKPTILVEILIDSWHSWIASLAITAGKSIPNGLKELIMPFQDCFGKPVIFEWLISDSTVAKTKIMSFMTKKEVQYTHLFVKDTAFQEKNQLLHEQPGRNNELDALEWLQKGKSLCKIIIGKPGIGKTTILREAFRKYLIDYLKGQANQLPVIARFSTYASSDGEFDWLEGETYPGMRRSLENAAKRGCLVLFADAWDEIKTDRQIEAQEFLKRLLKEKNRLILSSRNLDPNSYPKLDIDAKEKEDAQDYIIDKTEVLPLKNEQLDSYFRSRKPNLTNEQIRIMKRILKHSRIELTPLWMDTLVELDNLAEPAHIDEMTLLAICISQTEIYASELYERMEEAEKIAFWSLYKSEEFKITKNTSKLFISPETFHLLKKHGWLIPQGHYKGDKAYSFVHERLREYLAARYAWHNWDNLSKELFDRDHGILVQLNREILFEMVLREGERIESSARVLSQRIYEVAGEKDWFFDETINYLRLRDPILATYLFAMLKVPETNWSRTLVGFCVQIWEKYRSRNLNQNWKHWISERSILKAIYGAIPDLAISTRDTHYWISDLQSFDLPLPLLDGALEVISSHIFEDPKVALYFFEILERMSPRLGKWKREVINCLKFNVNRLYALVFGMHSGMKLLLKESPQDALMVYEKWVKASDERIRIASVDVWDVFEFHDLGVLERFARIWLQDSNTEVRHFAIDRLVGITQYLPFDPEAIISEVVGIEDYPKWLDAIHESYRFEWPIESRKPLLEWICNNKSLSETLDILTLYIRKSSEVFKNLIEVHPGPVDLEDVKKSINIVGEKLYIRDRSLFDLFLNKIVPLELRESISLIKGRLRSLKDEEEGWAIQLTADPRDEIAFWASWACIRRRTVQSLQGIEPILQGTTEVSKDIWNELFFDKELLERFMEIASIHENSEIRVGLCRFLFERYYSLLNLEKPRKIINGLLNDSEDQVRVFSACLLEFYPSNELEPFLNNLMTSSEENLRAIAIRIYAIKSGADFPRVVRKAISSVQYECIRPQITKTRITIANALLTSSQHEHFFSQEHDKEDRVEAKAQWLNFGIPTEFLTGFFDRITGDSQFGRNRLLTSFPVDPEEIKIFESIWLVSNVSPYGKEGRYSSNYLWLRKALEDPSEAIVLTALYYLEDLVLIVPSLISIMNSRLTELVKIQNSLIRGMTQYLLLLNTSKEQLNELWIKLRESEVNQQALWWGLGRRKDLETQTILLENLASWRSEELIDNLSLALPFILKSKTVYLAVWDKIISANLRPEQIGGPFVDRYFLDSRIKFVSWSLVCALDAKTSAIHSLFGGKESIEWINTIIQAINPKFHLEANECRSLLSKLSNLPNPFFCQLGRELLLEFNMRSLSEFFPEEISSMSLDELQFLYRHFDQLDNVNKVCLVETIFVNEKLHSNWKEEMLRAIGKLPTPEILPLLENALGNTNELFRFIAHESWLKIAPELFQNYYEETLEWLFETPIKPSLGTIPTTILEGIIQDTKHILNDNAQEIYWHAFKLLHPKLWYSWPEFWLEILKNE